MNFTPDINLRLLKDTIIVKVLKDKVSAGGIIIPETSSGINLIRAMVIKIGSSFRFKHDVMFGDIVYVPEHFGTILDLNNSDYKIYDGEDVYAVEDFEESSDLDE